MNCIWDHEKKAIKDHSAFEGLAVDDLDKFEALFMRPEFHLLEMTDDKGVKAHIVFEEREGGFKFHLVNFTKMKTKTMTEDFINGRVIPYCLARGLLFIEASVERKGMGRKLKGLGFENVEKNIYRRGVL